MPFQTGRLGAAQTVPLTATSASSGAFGTQTYQVLLVAEQRGWRITKETTNA